MVLQTETALLYYKAGPVVLQSRVGITKWGKFYYKRGQVQQSEATFITKWGRYYKVENITK